MPRKCLEIIKKYNYFFAINNTQNDEKQHKTGSYFCFNCLRKYNNDKLT